MSQIIPYSQPLVIVDVETTGGSAAQNRLIEIGIIRIENGKEVARYQSLINPNQSVPPFVQGLTGISDRDLESAPDFKDVADKIETFLKDALFVAHNARFDYDFIRHEFRRLGRRFTASTLCSARFSRALFPEHKRHNLAELIERHGLQVANHHRALDDAQAVWDLLRQFVNEVGSEKFSAVFQNLAHNRPARTLIAPERFENLPETAGVYAFRNADKKTIYVGKSSNLRERVLGHFYGDFDGPREAQIIAEAADLEWVKTPGELSALFLEAEWISKLEPQYSRKPKKTSGLVCVVKAADDSGYLRVQLALESEVNEKRDILAYYRGFRDAKQALVLLAEKFNLCPQLLDLEKGSGPCGAYRGKKCFGACAGKERPETYNARVERAFQQAGVESWPYPSAVLLDEQDEGSEQGEAYLVQNWLVIARVCYSAAGRRVEKLTGGFDWDQFKLLKRALQNSRIRPLTGAEMHDLLQEAEIKT